MFSHGYSRITALNAALDLLMSLPRIERDILRHPLLGIQIKMRVAQPAANSFTLPRRPRADVIWKKAAFFFHKNEDANILLAAINDKHAVFADDLVVAPQHVVPGSCRCA